MKTREVSDQAFFERISAESQTPEFVRFAEQSAGRPHPDAGILFEYAAGDLGEEEAGAIRAHLAVCGECAREALRLMQVADELEREAIHWADSPVSSGSPAADAAKTAGERAWLWLSELWQPQWAGDVLTAADLPEQSQTFTSEHGDILLTCHWQDDSYSEPALLSIAWKADLTEDGRLWLRFVNPVDQQLRQEVFLGSRPVGEEHFTIQDLSFDFVQEQWAISMALEAASRR